MKPNIFRYVVREDYGSAPRPFDGYCTLAICKPPIRKTAEVSDWIIGLRSGAPSQVVYVMQVNEILTFGEYWKDKRFANRKPGVSPVPDNIYFLNRSGQLEQKENPIHNSGNYETDVRGINVLVSNKFWYFGANSQLLPTDLIHLTPYPRGYTVHKNRRETDIEFLKIWLTPWKDGVHGAPINSTDKLLGWLAAPNSYAMDSVADSKESCGCATRKYRPTSKPGGC
ncbi:hypothetical protein O5O45_31785 [Hahella aquimaris]|uniref:Nmad2 family putative nucleotide modification protein n=1 Tax=Hahella sp. HNIBRBA332 TaxID=3015983 RepID=UPI00273BB629|nr:hypothetical protein [Hahella sp. HNIBRBA332]WLQ14301.1 hypothetical protein O5O45_31785 [Hahella sp. HNIBRBA332]